MIFSFDWLAQRAQVSPEHLALVFGEKRLTYADLNRRVAGMAAGLAAAGIGPGNRVAALLPNRVEYAVLVHALARVGAILVPLNTRLTGDELAWQADRAECAQLICSRETEEQTVTLFARTALQQRTAADREARTRAPQDSTAPGQARVSDARRRIYSVDPAEHHLIETLRCDAQDAAGWQSRPLDIQAPQSILFTSGTTGHPKGAILSFRAHFSSALASAYRLGLDPADRWLACLPLYHVAGQAILLRSCLYGTTVVLQDRFEPPAVNQVLDSVSIVSLVPVMLRRVLDDRGAAAFPAGVRLVLLGGAPAPEELLARARRAAVPLALTYGLTEAASQVATATPDEVLRKPGSVGKPLLFTQVKIVDDAGRTCDAGQIGQIIVQSPALMDGYYRQPAATLSALQMRDDDPLEGPWLHTGDLGYLDQQGDLWVVQRRTDLILSGGENVYPSEVEAVLLRHPLIRQACVVGLPDPEWGQRVAAALVAEDGLAEQEVIEHCRRSLAGYKIPRRIVFVQKLPGTASGKISRRAVLQVFEPLEME